jgi:hypothetical protein
MARPDDFWRTSETLVVASLVLIDRPQGAPHPPHASWLYPYGYGFQEGTHAGGGSWAGMLVQRPQP